MPGPRRAGRQRRRTQGASQATCPSVQVIRGREEVQLRLVERFGPGRHRPIRNAEPLLVRRRQQPLQFRAVDLGSKVGRQHGVGVQHAEVARQSFVLRASFLRQRHTRSENCKRRARGDSCGKSSRSHSEPPGLSWSAPTGHLLLLKAATTCALLVTAKGATGHPPAPPFSGRATTYAKGRRRVTDMFYCSRAIYTDPAGNVNSISHPPAPRAYGGINRPRRHREARFLQRCGDPPYRIRHQNRVWP